jgi:hypothetical protein
MNNKFETGIQKMLNGILMIFICLLVAGGFPPSVRAQAAHPNTLAGIASFTSILTDTLKPLADYENPVTVEGILSIRWIDEFQSNGSVVHKQEYLLQDGYNIPIVLELENNIAVPLGWPNDMIGQKIKVTGFWEPGTESISSLSGVESIFLADLIVPLQSWNITSSAVISGSKPFITILCKYPEEVDVTYPKLWFETMMGNQYPGMDYFWREVSYNNVDLTGSSVVGWYNLPKSRADYASLGGTG